VRLERGIATIDLGASFGSGADAVAVTARLAQVVSTVTGVPGVKGARVLVRGTPIGLPGVASDKPITRALLERGTPTPRALASHASATASPAIRALQQRLADLGFLRTGGVDGIAGPETRFATIAFQKWSRRTRDGVASAAAKRALERAVRPAPCTRGRGRRIEVLLDRQLALLVDGNRVVRAIHISSGSRWTPTPAGSYRVFRKERRSWSVPFRVWLPWASYFVGGIAFHEYPDVPTTAASHGCVRVPRYDSRAVFEFCPQGTQVAVLARS
jgi:hypothetical protein